MAWKDAEYSKEYHRQYMRERREWLRTHHFCTECKKQDARTLGGKSICWDCYERKTGHGYMEPKPKQKKKWKRKVSTDLPRKEWIENGLCHLCAKELFSPTMCRECYRKVLITSWIARKKKGVRPIYPPAGKTEKEKAAYQYCLDHREEYVRRWHERYDGERPTEEQIAEWMERAAKKYGKEID